ncbi:MAG: MFS transporter [Thermoleophilia bacterium]|nr:MFS transporter [Thermoleophilia bacterium]
MSRFGERLRESLRAFRSVYGNKGLRRLQLAWAGAIVGGWAYVISLAVYAYREDGAFAVGALAVARWVTAGLAAPLAGIAGDRYPRVRVLVASNVVRCAAIAGAGVAVLAGLSPYVVYALAVLAALAGTVFGPSESALIPTLARSPEELTAANVSASTIDSVGTFMGPALGGFLLAATSPEIAFFAAAGLVAWSAVVVSGVQEGPRAPRDEEEGALRGGLAGFRTLFGDSRLRLIAGLLAVYTLLDGALDVLIVVLALETLDLGDSGVGFLHSTAGIGGLLGIVVAAGFVGRKGLASPIGMGMAFWGVPILLIGLWPNQASALALLAAVGAATTIVGVAGDTLLQRAVPEEVLARVFGVLDSMMLVSIAIGAALAPTFVHLIGMRGTLIGVGAILPLLALVSWPRLREIDRAAEVPARPLELLVEHPIFAPLPPPRLEQLAQLLSERRVEAGETVVRQGEPGDDFFLVSDGLVRVTVDGAAAGELGPGEGFGEIALLRDVPRTATVDAVAPTTLYALDRSEFLSALGGHAESAAAAEGVAGRRLAAYRPATV